MGNKEERKALIKYGIFPLEAGSMRVLVPMIFSEQFS